MDSTGMELLVNLAVKIVRIALQPDAQNAIMAFI
jgi:hypothetical protein